jgi:hypothetical protein
VGDNFKIDEQLAAHIRDHAEKARDTPWRRAFSA